MANCSLAIEGVNALPCCGLDELADDRERLGSCGSAGPPRVGPQAEARPVLWLCEDTE
jgi:hypothetical protein